jgi:hypothetical protein
MRSLYMNLKEMQDIRRAVNQASSARYREQQQVFQGYFDKLNAMLIAFLQKVEVILSHCVHTAIQRWLDEEETDATEFPEFSAVEEVVGIIVDEQGDDPVLDPTIDPSVFSGATDVDEQNTSTRRARSGSVKPSTVLTHQRVAKLVSTSVEKYWVDNILGDLDPIGQMDKYFESMQKVEALLQSLEELLVPLSTKFPFFQLVVVAFNNEITHALKRYADPEVGLDAARLTEAMTFIRWYQGMLKQCGLLHYANVEELPELSASMMRLAVSGMESHLASLSRSCAETTCRSAPEMLPQGKIITNGPKDLFDILYQSIGAITTAVEIDVMRKLGMACVKAIRIYLEEIAFESDYDFWEEENAKGAKLPEKEWTEKRFAMLCAFLNDNVTIEANMSGIDVIFANCWGEETDETPFQKLLEELPPLSWTFVDEIVGFVRSTTKEAWKGVFPSLEWQKPDIETEANPMTAILNTIFDFIDQDFSALVDDQLKKLITKLFASFATDYFNALFSFLKDEGPKKGAKSKLPQPAVAAECFQRDINMFTEKWKDRVVSTPTKSLIPLEQFTLAIGFVKSMFIVKNEEEFADVVRKSVLDTFGDCPTFVVEVLIESGRPDVDKKEKGRWLARWQTLIAYQRRKDDINTSWTQAQTVLGSLNPSIGVKEKTGFFTSAQKAREKREAKQKKEEEEKKKQKKEQIRARKEAQASAVRSKKTAKKPTGEVEVVSLQDILK